MTDVLLNRRDLQFVLFEMLKIESLTQFDYFADHSRETFDMALDSAYDLARDVFWPEYQKFDEEGVQFDGEHVKAPEGMKAIWKAFQESGWFAATSSYDHGGQQFPQTLYAAASLIFNAANTTAAMYVGQATGAGHLVESFGSDFLKEKFLDKLYTGEYGGTMALTEPQAGTSLTDIKSTAVKAPDADYYFIKGTKRFISSGDHDITENIIHPTLAKIEGAPDGVQGISLFLVPKYRINEDGSLGQFNDVKTGGVEHKMGLKGQATATLNFGEDDACIGWLLGEPHRGLIYMFQLMNTARVHTGIQAIAQAANAYQHALEYSRERVQGREVTSKDPSTPQIPIIEHAEVRRMLLTQKAHVEGVIGLLLYCAREGDLVGTAATDEERQDHMQRLEILTPVCKAHGSDVAFECINLAIQCYGGSGYMEDYPLAQMLRDNKVFSIYEGTNNVQAMDLLGRKVAMEQGACFRNIMGEITKTIEEAKGVDDLKELAALLEPAMEECVATTLHLGQIGLSGDIEQYISHATPYLKVFSQLVVSWIFLWQCIVAQEALTKGTEEENFYLSKLATAKFYLNTILPTSTPLVMTMLASDRSALDFKEEWF